MKNSVRIRYLTAVAALFLLSACASARYPPVSEGGFSRLPGTKLDAVYLAEGEDPRSFKRFMVEPCSVTFRDGWMRDQNLDRAPRNRVTPEDMRRIEGELAADCREAFVDALESSEGLTIDETPGPEVLALLPSIVDLDVAAPVLLTPGRERTYTTSAGAMTLELQIADSATGEILGEVIDRRVSTSTGRATRATRSGNKAESDRILRSWAILLVEFLESGDPSR